MYVRVSQGCFGGVFTWGVENVWREHSSLPISLCGFCLRVSFLWHVEFMNELSELRWMNPHVGIDRLGSRSGNVWPHYVSQSPEYPASLPRFPRIYLNAEQLNDVSSFFFLLERLASKRYLVSIWTMNSWPIFHLGLNNECMNDMSRLSSEACTVA